MASLHFEAQAHRRLVEFYEAFIFLHSLGAIQGPRLARNDDVDIGDEDSAARKARRDYIKNLALLCDYDKGGPTVTAIAIQKMLQNLVYWVASNGGTTNRIAKFLREVLDMLSEMHDMNTEISEKLLHKSINFNARTIKKYSSSLRSAAAKCILYVSRQRSSSEQSTSAEHLSTHIELLQSMLPALQDMIDKNDPHALCEFAYEQSRTSTMTALFALASKAGSSPAEKGQKSEKDELEGMRHFIGRLAAYRYAVMQIVEFARSSPWILEKAIIRPCRAAEQSAVPPISTTFDFEDIVNRVLLVTDQEMKHTLLENMPSDVLNKMHKVLDENFKPKLHAELILLEAMWREKAEFVGGDKFIGCSKPACYCCYEYIRLHPSGMALPASHSKTYRNWRLPNTSQTPNRSDHIASSSIPRDMLTMLMPIIRNRAIESIYKAKGPEAFEFRFDSTTGLPSTGPTAPSGPLSGNFGTFPNASEATDTAPRKIPAAQHRFERLLTAVILSVRMRHC